MPCSAATQLDARADEDLHRGVRNAAEAARWCGAPPRRAGDKMFVSGTIGDAALGLGLRQTPVRAAPGAVDAAMPDDLVARYRLPQPRDALAEAVRTHACAAMDVSDGLAAELAKLCRASNASAEIGVGARAASRPPRAAFAADAAPDRADPDRRRGLRDTLRGCAGRGAAFWRRRRGERPRRRNRANRRRATRRCRFLEATGEVVSFSRARLQPFLTLLGACLCSAVPLVSQ